MKIFRGPSTKPLHDEAHELVSSISIKQSASYIGGAVIVLANITKEPLERQAVVHIQFDAEDIFALHQRLLAGLNAKASALESAKLKMAEVSKDLYSLFESIDYTDPEYAVDAEERIYDLKRQLEVAYDVVGSAASELDIRNQQQLPSDA